MNILEKFKKSEFAINVRSQEEYDNLMNFLGEKGFECSELTINPNRLNYYNTFKEKTAIICIDNFILYSSCDYALNVLHKAIVSQKYFMSNVKDDYVKKKGILDKEEKQYLEAVSKPFKNKIIYIMKWRIFDNDEAIVFHLMYEDFILPSFKKNTTYRGMQANKKYTLKELRLFEDE